MEQLCDVATEFEPVDWFTMKPIKWCGKPGVHVFTTDGQTHGIYQEHLDGIKDGCTIIGLDGEGA